MASKQLRLTRQLFIDICVVEFRLAMLHVEYSIDPDGFTDASFELLRYLQEEHRRLLSDLNERSAYVRKMVLQDWNATRMGFRPHNR